MQDQLRALVRLAEIDASARHIEEQLQGIPEELEERRHAVKALEDLVGAQKAQMEEAETLLAQQEDELKMRSDLLARSKAKSAKARNMREAEAAERELDAIRRSIREAEQEKERLQGVIEETKGVLAEPLAELEEQKSALDQAQEGSDEKLAQLRQERDEAVKGREEHAGKIPKRVYRRYERIRPKIHPAVVEAVDGVCKGCRMRIPPQLYNQIVAGDDFYQCQACHRFLYHKDVVLD
ncbi:MAG TPA: C4-type zinc ribbon domain-containing protein [Sandaracinaceae bacterium LLY-WYZ-13_1]|nr:C4-type zinc ribbon domain-containing protein [Sandaracinaceae bacterium LLY-WYZ-13_1]